MNRPTQGFQFSPDDNRQDRRAARNPAAEPAELRRLFTRREGRRAVTDALAANPAMPLEFLTQLIPEAPSAFCRNPIAPLVTLEKPDFLEKTSPLGLARLLRCARAPAPLVYQLAQGTGFLDYIQSSARRHVNFAPPIAEGEWIDTVRHFLWTEAAAVKDPERKQAVVELHELGMIPALMAAPMGVWELPAPQHYEAYRATLNTKQAKKLDEGYVNYPKAMTYETSDLALYAYIGATFSIALPVDTLIQWCNMKPQIAEVVARNPNASPAALTALAKSSDTGIRRLVLKNRSCPPEARAACQRIVFKRILGETPDYALQRHNVHWQPPLPWTFGRFFALLHAPEPLRRPAFHRFARSPLWEDRLAAAIAINDRPNGQPMKPRHRVLLEHLANDGINLVRAAAQGRLRGETFSLGVE